MVRFWVRFYRLSIGSIEQWMGLAMKSDLAAEGLERIHHDVVVVDPPLAIEWPNTLQPRTLLASANVAASVMRA